jgi:pimeloyl-ACP methyl ester carboxylesterase
MRLSDGGFLAIDGSRLEYRMIGPQPDATATIVMLHEGLGSVAQWGTFPDDLAHATGAGVFVYSRAGYGQSTPVPLPRPLTYMNDEALEVLPKLLDAIGFRRGILIGHSDGASVATIYAGSVQDHRIRGLSLIAPHFVVEDVSIASIAAAKQAYESTDLRDKLARWHRHVDVAFRGWNEAWLDPQFRKWDIAESLAYIRVPVQIVQGEADQYGTLRHIEIAKEECYCPVDVTLLRGIGHAPHREAPNRTLIAVSDFVNRILHLHGEGALAA